MLDWISSHSNALSVLANFGILAVWLFYAHVLLVSLRRQGRPRVLINQGKGQDLDSEVLVANMSQSGIFIQLLLAVVEADGERFSRSITDISVHEEGHAPERTRRATTQGPLSAGSYIALGRFRQIAQWVAPDSREHSRWQSLEIRVIFFYGTDYAPVAAYRRFGFYEGDNAERRIRPRDADTNTLRSWRYRRRIQRWLRENL